MQELTPLSILVTEDSEITCNLLNLLLAQRGHAVKCVADGETALVELSNTPYDVCLVDFHLPKMNGLEVVQSYRAKHGANGDRTRFIGMTADIEGLLAHPADCEALDLVFSKPIVASEVYAAVERVCSLGDGAKAVRSDVVWGPAAVSDPAGNGLFAVPGHDDNAAVLVPEAAVRERRRVRRATVSLSGTRIRRSNGEEHECRIVSLSSLGAGIQTNCQLALGEVVVVGCTNARVVRVRPNEIGVEFVRGQ